MRLLVFVCFAFVFPHVSCLCVQLQRVKGALFRKWAGTCLVGEKNSRSAMSLAVGGQSCSN